jgi:hypothetical protein
MGSVVYYTAVSLDGFVAGVGALVAGRTTFDWVIDELARTAAACS